MCDFVTRERILKLAGVQIPNATLIFRGYITGNVNRDNWNVSNQYFATDQVPGLGCSHGVYCLVSAKLLPMPENFTIGLSEEEAMRLERTKICFHYAYWNGASFIKIEIPEYEFARGLEVQNYQIMNTKQVINFTC